MKIYVITKGCYSDYHIVTATTDEAVAYALAKKFSDEHDDAEVEVYEDAEIMLRQAWFVRFTKSGELEELSQVGSGDEYMYGNINVCRTDIRGGVYVFVLADTGDGAIKIAAEKRAEYLAKKNGLA